MAGKFTTGLIRVCRATFSAHYNYCSPYSYFRCRPGFHNVLKKPSEMPITPTSTRAHLSIPFLVFFLLFRKTDVWNKPSGRGYLVFYHTDPVYYKSLGYGRNRWCICRILFPEKFWNGRAKELKLIRQEYYEQAI